MPSGRKEYLSEVIDYNYEDAEGKAYAHASDSVVSYTNALPRYVLFTVQYRLSIQPKKH